MVNIECFSDVLKEEFSVILNIKPKMPQFICVLDYF